MLRRPATLLVPLILATGTAAAQDRTKPTPAEPASPSPSPATERGRQIGVPWLPLETAVARNDAGEVARLSARIGFARVGAALRDALVEPRATPRSRAAIAAAGMLDGGLGLLPALVPLLSHPDDDLARTTTAIVARLLDGAEPDAYENWEVPPGTIEDACAAMARAVRDHSRNPDVRIAGLRALIAAASVCPTVAPDPGGFSDDIADIRRAMAIAATPAQVDALASLLTDVDARVVSAAAARLCQIVGPTGGDTARRETLLSAAERFARAGSAVPADVIELIDCVARWSGPGLTKERHRILDLATHSAQATVRKRAQQLLDARN